MIPDGPVLGLRGPGINIYAIPIGNRLAALPALIRLVCARCGFWMYGGSGSYCGTCVRPFINIYGLIRPYMDLGREG